MKILIIPHSPEYRFIHNRCHEVASGLKKLGHEIYFLEWETCKDRRISTLLKAQLNNLFSPFAKNHDNTIIYVRWPAINLKRGSYFFSAINSFLLNVFIKIYKINGVINSNINYYNLKFLNVEKKVFDVVDDHLEENKSLGVFQSSINLQLSNIKNSDYVTAITSLIAKKVNKFLDRDDVIVIDNGFYPHKFDLVSTCQANHLKSKLGITNKFIFGYIGGIDHWVRLELALEAFKSAFGASIDVAFIVVGGSPDIGYYNFLKNKYSSENCIFIGPIPKDIIASYFKILNVGLIPFELSDFTNNAFPIKALEYGYAGANVISSKLAFLEQMNFSFISFFANEGELKELMIHFKAKNYLENLGVSDILSKYSWSEAAHSFSNLLQ